MTHSSDSRRLRVFSAAALLGTLAAFFLSYPGFLGLTTRVPLQGVSYDEGYRWSAPFPRGAAAAKGRIYLPADTARVLEDGVALSRPLASARQIAGGGWGRYRVEGGKVLFSSSDGKDASGRVYEIQVAVFNLPEVALLAAWFGVLALWILCLRCGWCPPFKAPWAAVFAGLGFLWALGMVLRPLFWAGQFFETLWVPAVWSAGVAVFAARRGGLSLAGLVLISLLPAAASYLHYAVSGASHPSFLVVGAVPWSDAWMHFFQAAQIGKFGVTEEAFNGRYFYSLWLSAAMWLSGWNLQLALALLFGLSLLALALLCRVVRPMSGWTGSFLLVLGCALYLRAHVAGVCMTESLGFFSGSLAVVGLIIAAAKKSLRWFAAGLLLLSFGMAARPGALFVLPALGVCGAFLFSGRYPAKSLWLLAVFAAVVIAPFATNSALGKMLSTGRGAPFSNFAFSLHGMLLGQGWEASTAETGHDPARAMERSKELLLEQPSLLLSAYARSLEYVAGRNFLFRFGQEHRLAAVMAFLACIGLVGIWFLPGWRPQAPWMTAAAVGLFLSLPFAPPWDASERPYAVTVPMQCLVVAAGASFLVAGLRRLGNLPDETVSAEIGAGVENWSVALGTVLAVTLVIALVRTMALPGKITPPSTDAWPPDLRPGSSILVEDALTFRRNLSGLLAAGGAPPPAYLQVGRGAIVGIDWNRLAVIAVAHPPAAHRPEMVSLGQFDIDPAIRQSDRHPSQK